MFLGLLFAFALSAELTLQEEVGQVFLASIEGEDVVGFVERTALGNAIFYKYAPWEPAVVRSAVVARTGIPPLLAVDQEWGRVRHLDGVGTSGPELWALGFNLDLAPVVDLTREGVIGGRSFGSEVEEVVAEAEAFIEALKPVGCCLKHFPGHGAVAGDSHLELPVAHEIGKHLEPFRQLWPKADAIMTAHILVPEIDPDHCATLSPAAIGMLRSWGFDGVVVTDSLVMQGVSPEWSIDCHAHSAIEAFRAGCDLLLLQGEMAHVEGVMARFREAVERGEISRERLQESVERILALKERLP